jgi:hypothetical protein
MVESMPEVAVDEVAETAVPTAGAVTVAPEDPDADVVATGAVAAGVEDVVVHPAMQVSRTTSTAILMRATGDFIKISI